ncbi:SRPBCC domain-containing protein [Leptospira sp. 201903074]|uniref:SRPBCC family protein n=1 Tax=Leptospira abararensis TaxID=2810036 RepID=UPI001963185F|nr:SRPBCC family protein [Leptospira abararensis]MBM9546079.1 SRPBCC domain-containing protein [Leptospira abararensis]
MNPQVLKVEKRISADATRLFRAWLNADDFSRWFLSGEMIGIDSVTMDTRPGGKFLINMTLDGKILPHEGEYITIDEPHKLVFTWRSHATENRDTLVTVTFTDLTNADRSKGLKEKPQTLVTLIHEELLNDIQIKMHNQGWTSILESLNQWIDV